MTSTAIKSLQISCKHNTHAKFKGELRSTGALRNVEWQFHTDVSGEPIGPIFKGVSRSSQMAPTCCSKRRYRTAASQPRRAQISPAS